MCVRNIVMTTKKELVVINKVAKNNRIIGTLYMCRVMMEGIVTILLYVALFGHYGHLFPEREMQV